MKRTFWVLADRLTLLPLIFDGGYPSKIAAFQVTTHTVGRMQTYGTRAEAVIALERHICSYPESQYKELGVMQLTIEIDPCTFEVVTDDEIKKVRLERILGKVDKSDVEFIRSLL